MHVHACGSRCAHRKTSSEADPARGGRGPSSEADPARGRREPSSEADLIRGGFEPSSEADLARGVALLGRFGGLRGPPPRGSCCVYVLRQARDWFSVLCFLQFLRRIPPPRFLGDPHGRRRQFFFSFLVFYYFFVCLLFVVYACA
jgi:hypothetical protein